MRSARDITLFPEIHLPTPERPRFYTVRAHVYDWMDAFGGGTVPCLSVHGNWLESAGFKTNASVSVESTIGQLIVNIVEYPESTRERQPKNFERHIQSIGRATPENPVVHEHPGFLVREHILAPMGASTIDFAHAIGVSQDFAECFLAGDYDIDMDLAERLAPFSSTSQWLWWELQQKHRSGR